MIQMIFKIILPIIKSPRKGSGKSKNVTTEMAVSLKETILPAMLLRYQLIDIYNTDKLRLFYKDLKLTSNLIFPRVMLLMWQQSKAQIVGMAVRNAISERILMFIVGKSAKPRCFKHVWEILCRYIAQNKVWMNETIFEEWLHELDGRFKRRGLKILMIVNNCPVYPEITGLKVIDLQFLPPNTTSWRKLKDQKLIRCEFYARFLIIFGNLTSVMKTISLRKKKRLFSKNNKHVAFLFTHTSWKERLQSTM